MRNRAAALGVLGLAFIEACGGGSAGGGAASAGESGLGGSGEDAAGAGNHAAGGSAAHGGHTAGGAAGAGGSSGAASPGESGAAGSGDRGGTAGDDGSEAGAAGASDSIPTLPDLIDLTGTKFIDYGTLRITFKQAVNAAGLQLTLLPQDRLLATDVKAVDANTVDVSLSTYHLPRDYQIQVQGELASHSPFQTSAAISGLNNGSRVAFLSKATGSGKLQSWSSAPASATTPLEAADGVCQAEAEAVGFKGKFVAFLSARASYDAGCRALGLSGLLLNHCGLPSNPTDTAAWLSPNGMPIASGASAVVASQWLTPISFHADGSSAVGLHVWTGTLDGAKADVGNGPTSADCNGWTTTTNYAETASFTSEYLIQYGTSGSSCDAASGLICLQVGGTFFGTGALYRVAGKRAFVSNGTLTGAMSFGGKTGIAAGDALCQAEAAGAGYANATKFRAYLDTLATDAVCHVLGVTGKADAQCGLPALPSAPWRRADDYPVAAAAELATGHLTAPLSLTTGQIQTITVLPWTGLPLGSTPNTCADWTSADAGSSAIVGTPRSTSYGWSAYTTRKCSTPNPLFCFEG